MTNIAIMPLETKDTKKSIEVFFAAFEKDPLMDYFFGNKYQNLAKYSWQYICNLAQILDLLLLGAFVEGELQGVAFVTPPEVDNTNNQETIDKLDEQLAIAVGEAVIMRMETYMQIKAAHKPKQPHFYVNALGVMPKSQGIGIGKALMAELHKMSEESPQSSGVALDTENEQNLNFYQKLGYSVSTVTNVDNVKTWFMFRAQG